MLKFLEKLLDKKAKVTFKLYEVINWEINDFNIHIAHYPKKQKQSDYEIWSLNRREAGPSPFTTMPKVSISLDQ